MGDRAGRWFHTLVVVGTAMTACGGSTTVDARPSPDAGGTGSQPGVGRDSGSTDGAANAKDASPAGGDAATASDAAAVLAMCCVQGTTRCRMADAGVPICGPLCCNYCGCIQ